MASKMTLSDVAGRSPHRRCDRTVISTALLFVVQQRCCLNGSPREQGMAAQPMVRAACFAVALTRRFMPVEFLWRHSGARMRLAPGAARSGGSDSRPIGGRVKLLPATSQAAKVMANLAFDFAWPNPLFGAALAKELARAGIVKVVA
jgi:hypothetical protein